MKKILIIGFVWPEPNATAAGSRMLQLIHFFLKENYHITFASTATETSNSYDLSVLEVDKKRIELNSSTFDVFINELQPDIVLFDRFMIEEQFGWRVAKQIPKAIRILDSEDLHSLRTARHNAFKADKDFLISDWLQIEITKREIASIYRCDFTLIISSFEIELLTRELQIDDSLLLYLPFMLDKIDDKKQQSWLPYQEKNNFICIGNGKHAPNIAAIQALKNNIWPLIHKALPKAELHIYGAYLPQSVEQMHKPKEGFLVKGKAVEAIETIGNYKINLTPLKYGAGIKGKLVDGMLAGTPSITTTIGAEGMHANFPWNGDVVNDDEAFATSAIALYSNEEKWKTVQENGVTIINSLYDKIVVSKALKLKIEKIQDSIIQHRNKNFTGAMLMHHTMMSTKYLSRWIEEKNK